MCVVNIFYEKVKFHYIGYNENGRRIDSSYQQGEPARTRLGIKGMIPGTSSILTRWYYLRYVFAGQLLLDVLFVRL